MGYTIAHYHVPPSVVQHLQEDSEGLREIGIEWAILTEPLTGTLIINHSPKRFSPGVKASKHQSPEIRDSLLAIPSIAKLLECSILLNKWDVWVRPSPGIAVELFAAQVRNLDDLTVTDAAQLKTVKGPVGPPTVSPPDILVSHPARLLPTSVIARVASFVPVASHQPTHRPGLMLIRLASTEAATILYGSTIPSPFGTITITSGTDIGDTHWEKSHSLARCAPMERRQQLLSALEMPPPPLTAESLLGLQASPPGDTTMISENGSHPPKPIAALFQRPHASPRGKGPQDSSPQGN